jgi:hypothetical protein
MTTSPLPFWLLSSREGCFGVPENTPAGPPRRTKRIRRELRAEPTADTPDGSDVPDTPLIAAVSADPHRSRRLVGRMTAAGRPSVRPGLIALRSRPGPRGYRAIRGLYG